MLTQVVSLNQVRHLRNVLLYQYKSSIQVDILIDHHFLVPSRCSESLRITVVNHDLNLNRAWSLNF